MHDTRRRLRRRRAILVGVVAAVLVAVAAVGVGGYLLTRTIGSPQQTAASYPRGWQRAATPRWSAGPIANAFLRNL